MSAKREPLLKQKLGPASVREGPASRTDVEFHEGSFRAFALIAAGRPPSQY